MASHRLSAWVQFAILILMLAAFAVMKCYQNKSRIIPAAPKTETRSQPDITNHTSKEGKTNTSIPNNVYEVYQYIKEHKEAPESYVGGRIFNNREKRLPHLDQYNKKIKYQEWDVNPKIKGQNRGAERLITGSDATAYYTTDHYKTFTKIN